MICTFFGHKNASKTIKFALKKAVIDLIENKDVNLFYVGNNGSFDSLVRELLKELKITHNIKYYVVLAYMPQNNTYEDYTDTIYFDELNTKPYKVRIIERNKIMIEKSDYVITHVTHITGGSYEFKLLAEKKGKNVINIS